MVYLTTRFSLTHFDHSITKLRVSRIKDTTAAKLLASGFYNTSNDEGILNALTKRFGRTFSVGRLRKPTKGDVFLMVTYEGPIRKNRWDALPLGGRLLYTKIEVV